MKFKFWKKPTTSNKTVAVAEKQKTQPTTNPSYAEQAELKQNLERQKIEAETIKKAREKRLPHFCLTPVETQKKIVYLIKNIILLQQTEQIPDEIKKKLIPEKKPSLYQKSKQFISNPFKNPGLRRLWNQSGIGYYWEKMLTTPLKYSSAKRPMNIITTIPLKNPDGKLLTRKERKKLILQERKNQKELKKQGINLIIDEKDLVIKYKEKQIALLKKSIEELREKHNIPKEEIERIFSDISNN
jgi:hypothetical protein